MTRSGPRRERRAIEGPAKSQDSPAGLPCERPARQPKEIFRESPTVSLFMRTEGIDVISRVRALDLAHVAIIGGGCTFSPGRIRSGEKVRAEKTCRRVPGRMPHRWGFHGPPKKSNHEPGRSFQDPDCDFRFLLVTAGQIVRDPQWGFSFQVPQGWRCEHDASGAVLGHSTIPGMILVLLHTAASAVGFAACDAGGA